MRSILHLDIDSFFVSCERLGNRTLNNAPLIIGGSQDRGIVASCSYEARLYNVRVGMPMGLAQRLCPEAKVIKGDLEFNTKKSLEITEIIKEKAPVMEKSSIDEFYVDISGMDRYIGYFPGLDMADGDILRRAMSGKKVDARFSEVKERFFENCNQFGYSEA